MPGPGPGAGGEGTMTMTRRKSSKSKLENEKAQMALKHFLENKGNQNASFHAYLLGKLVRYPSEMRVSYPSETTNPPEMTSEG